MTTNENNALKKLGGEIVQDIVEVNQDLSEALRMQDNELMADEQWSYWMEEEMNCRMILKKLEERLEYTNSLTNWDMN